MSTARLRILLPLAAVLVLAAAPAPARAVQVRIVPVVANDVVYNPHDGMLYVSVPSLAPLYGNTITRVDPVSGAVGPSVAIGSEPRKLALSTDGTALWVGLDGAAAIRKVDLGSFTAGPSFPLGSDSFLGPYYAEDLEVLPGSPNSVAVSLRNQGFSPRHMGVAVYDNGVRRPTMTPGHTGSNIIVFSNTASRLYGQNIETTEFGFRRMNVTATGVTVLESTQNLMGGFGGDIFFDNGRVYSTGGEVIDPEARVLLGRFSFPDFVYGSAMVPDGARAWIALRSFFGSGEVRIQVFDTQTFTPVMGYPLPGLFGTPTALRRWGADGLALRVDDGTLAILSDIQSPPTCDLVLTKTDDRDPVAVDEDLYYRLRVANLGLAPAEMVTIRDPIPPLTSFQYASHPRGSCYDSLGTIVCSAYSTLAAGDSFEILVVLRPLATGTVTNTASVTTTTPDAHPADNTDSETTQIRETSFDRADLYVAFESAPPAAIVEGESFDVAVALGNRGPGEATETRLYSSFFGTAAAVELLSGPGDCAETFSPALSCSLGVVPAGGTAHLTVRVRPLSSGYLGTGFSMYAHEQDVNYSDNYVNAYTLVFPSAPRLIDSLAAAVDRLDLNHGQHEVLTRQLEDALAALAARDTARACKELADFQEWMSRWTGRALDLDVAYALSIQCRMIQGLLGCFGPPGSAIVPAGASDTRRDWRNAGSATPAPGSAPPATGVSAPGDVIPDPIGVPIPGSLELRTTEGESSGAPTIGMPSAGAARLELLDVQGRVVRTVFEGALPAGSHAVRWDTSGLPAGVYFYRLSALGRQAMAKVAIVK